MNADLNEWMGFMSKKKILEKSSYDILIKNYKHQNYNKINNMHLENRFDGDL